MTADYKRQNGMSQINEFQAVFRVYKKFKILETESYLYDLIVGHAVPGNQFGFSIL